MVVANWTQQNYNIRYKSDPTKEIVIEDNWSHAQGGSELAEQWTGCTIFDYDTETKVPTKVEETTAMDTRGSDNYYKQEC